jgi:hypothetical protein
MYRSLAGVAAVVALAAVAVPTAPANAAAIRHASGITEHQSNIEPVQYRRYRHGYWGGYYGPRRYYGYGYRRPYYGGYYGGYYPYAYGPYPYYRGYYRPRPFVGIGIGPVGVGVW